MFIDDQPLIQTFARNFPSSLASTLTFCISTANASLQSAVNTTDLVKNLVKENRLQSVTFKNLSKEEKSSCGAGLTQQKLTAIQFVWENKEIIHEVYLNSSAEEFWHYLLDSCKGLGLIKAAFAVQCLYGKFVCLDIHNARNLNLDYKLLLRNKSSKKAREYYLTVSNLFDSQTMWDDWCNFYAEKYSNTYPDGDSVSKAHLVAIYT